MTKGFITIATGEEAYYRLARNLLHSYRWFSREPVSFAILADRENAYTSEFDDVLLFPDGASNSYLDKLSLAEFAPYDITIFLDADCLAYGDLNVLFDYFQEADDFSCFGRVLPLDARDGWFLYENLGDLKEKVSYIVGLHGGIYYMRRGACASRIFETAKGYLPDYPKYKFKGNFDTPGDEPVVALSMAVNGCRPICFVKGAICCYWEYTDHMDIDITQGKAVVTTDPQTRNLLLHWGTRFTRGLEYKKQVELLEILESADEKKAERIRSCVSRYKYRMLWERIRNLGRRVIRKLLRIAGIQKANR